MPLICLERACGRARRCVGRSRSLPPCWAHYHEETRFLVRTMMQLRAHIEATGERPDPAAPMSERSSTVLEALYGPNLSRLRRPKGVPGPEGCNLDAAAFERYMAAGHWRNPAGAAQNTPPAPVSHTGEG